MQMQKTLFEKYGGFAQINRLVMAFYEAVLDSDELGPYFDGTDMARLIDHQSKFITYLFEGPADFSEERLTAAHQTLGVTHAHFDELKTILSQTLFDHGFEAVDTDWVLNEFEKRRPLIVR